MAVVTEDPRLVLEWRGKEIVNLSRAFLDTNGAHQETDVEVEMPVAEENYFKKIATPKVAEAVAAVSQADIDTLVEEYYSKYQILLEGRDEKEFREHVAVQAGIEIGFERSLEQSGILK